MLPTFRNNPAATTWCRCHSSEYVTVLTAGAVLPQLFSPLPPCIAFVCTALRLETALGLSSPNGVGRGEPQPRTVWQADDERSDRAIVAAQTLRGWVFKTSCCWLERAWQAGSLLNLSVRPLTGLGVPHRGCGLRSCFNVQDHPRLYGVQLWHRIILSTSFARRLSTNV